MKHIRLFEGFNKDEYYIEVPKHHFDFSSAISINGKELELLENFLKVYRRKYLKGMNFFLTGSNKNRHSWFKIVPYKNIEICVTKFDDEYYCVSVLLIAMWVPSNPGSWDFSKESWIIPSNTHGIIGSELKYYKCDQWDGLIKCLDDLLNEYKNKGI
jgi:hypothetical protein